MAWQHRDSVFLFLKFVGLPLPYLLRLLSPTRVVDHTGIHSPPRVYNSITKQDEADVKVPNPHKHPLPDDVPKPIISGLSVRTTPSLKMPSAKKNAEKTPPAKTPESVGIGRSPPRICPPVEANKQPKAPKPHDLTDDEQWRSSLRAGGRLGLGRYVRVTRYQLTPFLHAKYYLVG
ncbi:predicted protein [Histoplasma capsulatum G186AR]|uniref:Uncharacterized protein n=1 Tax=Ajellomyces capsulatus (strain G186AR / H82 / ATCC MYA-2454 / RMSCC 2432) TaxID=447093 RepID=C0P0N9_AJECG|nr:uncharacterized protein HCBG_08969 [Histoplasma capsulatum G186AR]EEH02859.1 predicted protein [Histoplasma capsulatum G186AR]